MTFLYHIFKTEEEGGSHIEYYIIDAVSYGQYFTDGMFIIIKFFLDSVYFYYKYFGELASFVSSSCYTFFH